MVRGKARGKKPLKEYTDLGGNGTPNCSVVDVAPKALVQPKQRIMIRALSTKGLVFSLPEDGACSITLFNSAGKNVLQQYAFSGKKGQNKLNFSKKIGLGVYIVQVKAGNASVVERKADIILQ